MRSRSEAPLFNERDWACVSLQAPLGPVILARKLPVISPRVARSSGAVSDWINRLFEPSNPPGSTTKRARSRRST